jgi:hypothetical protein
MMSDLMFFSKKVPTVPVQRRMNLGPVAAARAIAANRVPWPAIFAKAMAMVAEEYAPLRQIYMRYPWPHLYEYPTSTAVIAIERIYHEEAGVFYCLIENPASRPLNEIRREVRDAVELPLEQVKNFRLAMRIARLPLLLRRFIWWLAIHSGRERPKYFGTFAVSSVAALGIDVLHPLSLWTALLTYGPLSPNGQIDVRIIMDHRVLDAAQLGRIMIRMEEILNGPITAELQKKVEK